MFKLLKQPYPAADAPMRELRKALFIGLFIGLFLLVFQPFGLASWETTHKLLKIIGFGVITFVITAVNSIIWPRLFPRLFIEEKWTVGREILSTLINVLLIALANRIYIQWLLGSNFDQVMGWVGMLIATFLIGLFPVTGLVLLNYIRQLKKYSESAAALPIHTPPTPDLSTEPTTLHESGEQVDPTITLVADNEKDSITTSADDLLYVESSDNYCTVVYLANGQSKKPLLRSSLSRLEKQITRPHIVRCHRSYIVNLDRVERVTGNAQGYKLHLLNGQFQVPVARQYNETLVAELKSL